ERQEIQEMLPAQMRCGIVFPVCYTHYSTFSRYLPQSGAPRGHARPTGQLVLLPPHPYPTAIELSGARGLRGGRRGRPETPNSKTQNPGKTQAPKPKRSTESCGKLFATRLISGFFGSRRRV